MINPPARPDPLRSAARLCLWGGPALAVLALAYLFLTPEIYEAAARIRISRVGRDTASVGTGSLAGLMLPEFEFLRSEAFLDGVVSNLHLQTAWAAPGPAARQLLNRRVRLGMLPGSSILQAQATSANPQETAAIANEIARLYCDHRETQNAILSREKLEALAGKLQPQLDEETRLVAGAEERLQRVVEAIEKERAAAGVTIYDARSFQLLQSTRLQAESDYVAAQNLFLQLKALSREQLRQVLPTLGTNLLLNQSIDALIHAQTELAAATATRGAEAPEVRRAAAGVELLNQTVAQCIDGALRAREADLLSKKALLDELNRRLSSARTNLDSRLTSGNPEYQAALRNLEDHRHKRELLTDQLANTPETRVAVRPLTLSAELVDSAQPPSAPVSPDRRLGLGAVGAGAAACIAGVGLLGLSARRAGSRPRSS